VDSGVQAALIIGLTTVILPLLSSKGVTLLLGSRGYAHSSVVGLITGLIVSYGGVLELSYLWGADAMKWLLLAPLLSGLGLSLINRTSAGRVWSSASLLSATLMLTFAISAYLIVAPLGALWRDGVTAPLLSEWLISGLLLAGLSCREALRGEESASPAHLAGLALSLGVAAPVVGLSGSASLAQLLGAYGLAVAGVGLVSLWRGVRVDPVTYVVGYVGLFSALLYAHFYLVPALSTSAVALLLTAPSMVSLTTRWREQPVRRVLMSVLLTSMVAGPALGLIAYRELTAQPQAQEVDEFGASY